MGTTRKWMGSAVFRFGEEQWSSITLVFFFHIAPPNSAYIFIEYVHFVGLQFQLRWIWELSELYQTGSKYTLTPFKH